MQYSSRKYMLKAKLVEKKKQIPKNREKLSEGVSNWVGSVGGVVSSGGSQKLTL
jgi:hypothetical protein